MSVGEIRKSTDRSKMTNSRKKELPSARSNKTARSVTGNATVSETEITINSLQERVKILELKCVVADDLYQENIQLKERVEQAEVSKDTIMRLLW